ncbi:unnamed protein product [Lactuca saligna]|uniref:Reverse transcriptase zinc-binding domain-containing protein n=1 Tax=Lactuca saligna TaxID=75948 RepID=A0AA36EB28_LACSI|nr:unnamed protein product [Lactuca saligna]
MLHARGISVNNPICSLCEKEPKIVDHLLSNCEFTHTVREWVFKWIGISLMQFNNVTTFLDQAASWGNFPRKNRSSTPSSTVYFRMFVSEEGYEGRGSVWLGVSKGRRPEKSSDKKHDVVGGSVASSLTGEEEMCERTRLEFIIYEGFRRIYGGVAAAAQVVMVVLWNNNGGVRRPLSWSSDALFLLPSTVFNEGSVEKCLCIMISNQGTKNAENVGINVTKAQELLARSGQHVNPISCITSTSKTTPGTSDSQSLGNSMVYLLYPLMLIAAEVALGSRRLLWWPSASSFLLKIASENKWDEEESYGDRKQQQQRVGDVLSGGSSEGWGCGSLVAAKWMPPLPSFFWAEINEREM